MNTGRLIGGSICLAVAVLLAVLALVLPADRFSFMVEGTNMPMVPSIVLGVIGLLLLATAGKRGGEAAETQETPTEEMQVEDTQRAEKRAMNKRLESIGWALFLIMIGCIGLIPDEQVPEGLWSIGVGVIMLGLNAARYFYKIKMSGFTIIVGSLALISGLADIFAVDLPILPILLILLGAHAIIRPLIEKNRD